MLKYFFGALGREYCTFSSMSEAAAHSLSELWYVKPPLLLGPASSMTS